jgi:hypothetical protein
MKTVIIRFIPVLVATSFWLVGNLISSAPVSGNEEVAKNYGSCIPDMPIPLEEQATSCTKVYYPNPAIENYPFYCTGSCYYYGFHTSHCDFNQQGSSSNACKDGGGYVLKDYYSGPCVFTTGGHMHGIGCTCDGSNIVEGQQGQQTSTDGWSTCNPSEQDQAA